MDPNIPAQPTQPVTPGIQASITGNSNKIKYSLFGLTILLMMVAIGGAYYLGITKQQPVSQKSSNKITITSIPTSIPIVTTSPVINIPIGKNTVSYADVNGKIILRYQNKFFDIPKNLYEPEEISLPDENNYKWTGLVNRPESETPYVYDEMFSFDTLPNNLGFIFVMRWEAESKNLNGGIVNSMYKVFYFDNKKNKLSNPLSFKPYASQSKYQIPKIDKISSGGEDVSFSMFGCWNCGGHKPETSLLNLETNSTKRIGKVEDFTWSENGNYTYKEYKVIDCTEPQPGECTEDPAILPLLKGQF